MEEHGAVLGKTIPEMLRKEPALRGHLTRQLVAELEAEITEDEAAKSSAESNSEKSIRLPKASAAARSATLAVEVDPGITLGRQIAETTDCARRGSAGRRSYPEPSGSTRDRPTAVASSRSRCSRTWL